MDTFESDRELRKWMKKIRLENPGADFSSKVMDAVFLEASSKAAYRTQPLLGWKFWVFVGLFAALAVVLMLLSGSEQAGSSEIATGLMEKLPTPDFSLISSGFAKLMASFSELPATLGVIMISCTILIGVDSLFSKRSHVPAG